MKTLGRQKQGTSKQGKKSYSLIIIYTPNIYYWDFCDRKYINNNDNFLEAIIIYTKSELTQSPQKHVNSLIRYHWLEFMNSTR